MSASTQEHPFTVSALTMELKSLVEGRYSRIYVEGEISGWRPSAAGHAYFTVKDGGAQMSAVMFRSSLERCRARAALKDGAKVLLYANASFYVPRGECQLVVLAAKPVGEGDLMQRYLELKAKLEKEGLFDAARKRPLPALPRRIGIVTSPTGAVVHDMCRVLMRRFPRLEIRIFPAVVQGEAAAASVAEGLRFFAGDASWRADVVIFGRGGGSFEDLFCFNDEALVRAVASSPIPTVSAVGHETDFTLCDFAADVRAGTPSMAAELVVPEYSALMRRLADASSSIVSSLRGKYEWYAQRIDGLADDLGDTLWRFESDARKRLDALSARVALALAGMESACGLAEHKVARHAEAMSAALKLRLVREESALSSLAAKLDLLSPYSVLERGYSITTDAEGRVVRSASDVASGDLVRTRLRDGSFESRAV
jgi:exodeoxyribonuclease VII large subunit